MSKPTKAFINLDTQASFVEAFSDKADTYVILSGKKAKDWNDLINRTKNQNNPSQHKNIFNA